MQNTITLAKAIQMTTLYRHKKEEVLKPGYAEKNVLPTCESFERAAFDKVLAQPGCKGLRIYLGMDEALQVRALIVGVDGDDKDMLPSTDDPGAGKEEENIIIETGAICPPVCPPKSPLNP
jgi:hypothetical protein